MIQNSNRKSPRSVPDCTRGSQIRTISLPSSRTMLGCNHRRCRPPKLWIYILVFPRYSFAFRAPMFGGKRMAGATAVVDRESVKAYILPASSCARSRFSHATRLLDLDSRRRNPENCGQRFSSLSSEELSTSESESVRRESAEVSLVNLLLKRKAPFSSKLPYAVQVHVYIHLTRTLRICMRLFGT